MTELELKGLASDPKELGIKKHRPSAQSKSRVSDNHRD